jgi:hypothetical protein
MATTTTKAPATKKPFEITACYTEQILLELRPVIGYTVERVLEMLEAEEAFLDLLPYENEGTVYRNAPINGGSAKKIATVTFSEKREHSFFDFQKVEGY